MADLALQLTRNPNARESALTAAGTSAPLQDATPGSSSAAVENVLRCLTAEFDFSQIGGVLSQAQIVICLQVHPKLRRQSEVLPQS